MGTGGWAAPRRTEIVYESERTRVTRLFYPDQTLIRKEPLGPDAERRLEHETAVLAGLRGAAGLAQLAEVPWYPGSVLLLDAGRANLAGPARPLAAGDLTRLALRLARALANLHDREVIHLDLSPANVVLSDDDGDPCLVDFAHATTFAQARHASTARRDIAATMAYRAPELTGRAVDQRADLYGLGATLYELATGEPPIGHDPAPRLLHDRLARVPVPPAEVVPGLPASLSAIIMHLLEKDPDDRYQSASGVVFDLERLREPRRDHHRAAQGAERAALLGELDDLLGILSAAQALSSDISVERLHTRVTEVLAAMTGATGVRLVLWDDERQGWRRAQSGDSDAVPGGNRGEPEVPMSVLRYLRRTREPLVVADTAADDRFARDPYFTDVGCCSLLAMPILGHGTPQAALLLENRLVGGAFTAARIETVKLIAGQLAVSLRNAQLYAENRRIDAAASAEVAASRARVIAAADQARRRIERDLHDGAQQRLVSLALQLRQAQAAVPPGLADLSAELDRAVTAANSALDEISEIARGIHPAILTSGGLRPAVRALARRSPVPIRLEQCTDLRLPEYVEVTAYYVIAEAVTNATKHARASVVSIRAELAGQVLIVTIRDDGIGGADPARGTGLTGLRDRAETLGGVIRMESPPGAGTMLRVELPLAADSGAARDGRYAQ
jgi:signal transduction histidine kinase